jgi:cell fate regulator YaaT (PSP1 superfamily)
MRKKDVKDNYEVKRILRKANDTDIARWQEARALEQSVMMRARVIANNLKLAMKISDVEFQGDKTKATFFYTADDRVDFRELIKRYADEFKTRIDMRQIGYRVEAARVGGIGSCGRELCCSSWLTDFRAVSTGAARYQQLSINPAKLAGQCGKLKCCLNYELDQYVEALRDIPSVNTKLHLPKGTAYHFKTDIFQKVMYFVYEQHSSDGPFALGVEAVKEIIEKNRRGVSIESIDSLVQTEDKADETDFAKVVGQDSLTRFDKRRSNPQRRRNQRNQDGKREDSKRTPERQEPENTSSGSAAPKAPQRNQGGNRNRERNRPNHSRNNPNRAGNKSNENPRDNAQPKP